MSIPDSHTDITTPRQVNQTTTFKFIVTSVPFTSLWTHDAQTDSWAGYAAEKASLLSALHTVPNVYLLSGDRHEFAEIEFNPVNEAGEGAHRGRRILDQPAEHVLRAAHPHVEGCERGGRFEDETSYRG